MGQAMLCLMFHERLGSGRNPTAAHYCPADAFCHCPAHAVHVAVAATSSPPPTPAHSAHLGRCPAGGGGTWPCGGPQTRRAAAAPCPEWAHRPGWRWPGCHLLCLLCLLPGAALLQHPHYLPHPPTHPPARQLGRAARTATTTAGAAPACRRLAPQPPLLPPGRWQGSRRCRCCCRWAWHRSHAAQPGCTAGGPRAGTAGQRAWALTPPR